MTTASYPTIFKEIGSSDSFLVCCFYTDSYRDHALSLKQSLDNLNLNYYFKEVDDGGYWEANTRIKPHFILECLQLFPDKNVLYLDADAIVKQTLNYFNNITSDIAIYHTKRAQGMSHDYLTGTIFFRNNQVTKDFVQEWCIIQNDCKDTMVDQDSFDQAIEINKSNLIVDDLPLGYIKIFDKDYDGDIYIEQYQASRGQTKLKRQRIRWRNRVIGGTVAILLAALVYSLLS